MSDQKAEAKVISEVKDKIEEVIPSPPETGAKASAQALKERLQWGKPGLTIIDARDRESFLEERITGAMFIEDVTGLPKNREIYVYGGSNDETAKAADKIRQQGFSSVSQIQGGLAGWKAVMGPVEGRNV